MKKLIILFVLFVSTKLNAQAQHVAEYTDSLCLYTSNFISTNCLMEVGLFDKWQKWDSIFYKQKKLEEIKDSIIMIPMNYFVGEHQREGIYVQYSSDGYYQIRIVKDFLIHQPDIIFTYNAIRILWMIKLNIINGDYAESELPLKELEVNMNSLNSMGEDRYIDYLNHTITDKVELMKQINAVSLYFDFATPKGNLGE